MMQYTLQAHKTTLQHYAQTVNKRRLITLLARAVLIAMILPAVSMTAHAELKV
jgi:hypothetical protein